MAGFLYGRCTNDFNFHCRRGVQACLVQTLGRQTFFYDCRQAHQSRVWLSQARCPTRGTISHSATRTWEQASRTKQYQRHSRPSQGEANPEKPAYMFFRDDWIKSKQALLGKDGVCNPASKEFWRELKSEFSKLNEDRKAYYEELSKQSELEASYKRASKASSTIQHCTQQQGNSALQDQKETCQHVASGRAAVDESVICLPQQPSANGTAWPMNPWILSAEVLERDADLPVLCNSIHNTLAEMSQASSSAADLLGMRQAKPVSYQSPCWKGLGATTSKGVSDGQILWQTSTNNHKGLQLRLLTLPFPRQFAMKGGVETSAGCLMICTTLLLFPVSSNPSSLWFQHVGL